MKTKNKYIIVLSFVWIVLLTASIVVLISPARGNILEDKKELHHEAEIKRAEIDVIQMEYELLDAEEHLEKIEKGL